jgi:hypothetical protein
LTYVSGIGCVTLELSAQPPPSSHEPRVTALLVDRRDEVMRHPPHKQNHLPPLSPRPRPPAYLSLSCRFAQLPSASTMRLRVCR